MRRAIVLVLILVLAAPIPPVSAQAGAAAELGGIFLALQNLKSELDSALNTADQETAARIRQAEIALDQLIKNVKDAMDHGYGLIINTRSQIMGNIADVMIQTENTIQDESTVVLLGVNDSLANLARIVTAVPGIKIPTYVYAVTPLRFAAGGNDRHVEVHGFFPDVTKDHPAKVHFENGTTIQLDSYVNNTLGFDLPPNSLSAERSFIKMTFVLPVKGWFFYSDLSLAARVYVEPRTPFAFDVTINIGNPKQWTTITATSPLVERADSSRTTNNQTLTAPEVFSMLINDDIHYDMSTARFINFSPPPPPPRPPLPPLIAGLGINFHLPPPAPPPIIDQGSNPCASGCTSSSGSFSWDEQTVRISLSAPECATHVIWPSFPQTPYQCGGGTHADFKAFPTFRVKVRGQDASEVPADNQPKPINLSRKNASEPIPLPNDWTSIQIKGTFKDVKQDYTYRARLTSGPTGLLSASEPILWKAEVQGQTLVISTR